MAETISSENGSTANESRNVSRPVTRRVIRDRG